MNKIDEIQRNPLKSVFIISIPIIGILFLQTFYSIVDAYWIAKLGKSAIIAIGYVLNLWYVLQKLGEGIGRSCNVIISTSFGAKEYEKANNVACHGLIIILVLSIIFPILFILLIKPICYLGHIEQYSDLITNYFMIPSILIIFVLMSNYFTALLFSEGDTKRAAHIVIFGNLLNIILDPILIFNFNLGIFGAGLATIIGCITSFLIFYYIFYIKGDSVLKIGKSYFKYDKNIFKEIIYIAIPLILNAFILTILGLLVNYSLHLFSNPIISFGYVILLRIQTLMFTPVQGVSQGFCIVTAHLTGAKRFKKLASTLKKSLVITCAFATIFGLIYLFSYTHIIPFFSDDINVKNAVSSMIIFSILTFFLQPAVRICNYTFVGLGKSIYSLLSLILNVSLFILFMLIGSLIFKSGEFGIFISVLLSDLLQVIIMLLLTQRTLSNLIHKVESKTAPNI